MSQRKDKAGDIQEVDYIQREPEKFPSFQVFQNNLIRSDSLYNATYPEKLYEYFIQQRIEKRSINTMSKGIRTTRTVYSARDLPTFEGFRVKYAISLQNFNRWLKRHELFQYVFDHCLDRLKYVMTQNIADGTYSVKAGTLLAQNYSDIRERFDLENLQNQNFKFELNYSLKEDRPNPNVIDADYKEVKE